MELWFLVKYISASNIHLGLYVILNINIRHNLCFLKITINCSEADQTPQPDCVTKEVHLWQGLKKLRSKPCTERWNSGVRKGGGDTEVKHRTQRGHVKKVYFNNCLNLVCLFSVRNPKKVQKNKQKNKYIKGLEITSMKTKTHCVASLKSIQAFFLQYLYILTGLVRQTSKPLSSFILTFFFYIDVLRMF